MEFGLELVCDQVQAGSSYWSLVADWFAAGLSQIPLCCPGLRQVQGSSQTC